ncbi:MAG: ABC transporter permease [Pseudomonadota bacterium]
MHPAVVPKALRGWVIPVALLVYWWAAYYFHVNESPLFVSMGQVAKTALKLGKSGELWHALSASLYRMLMGFTLGSLAGLIVGGGLGLSRRFEGLVGPTFHAIKQVSLLAWIPLISLWFGLGDTAKIAFLSLAAFFPLALNTFEGIRSVQREFVEVAHVFAYSRWQLFRRVVLPAALPSIFTGVQLALIYSWLATLGAEFLLTSGVGIGNLLIDGREHLWMDYVLLGIAIVGIVGFVLQGIAQQIETRLLGIRSRTLGKPI